MFPLFQVVQCKKFGRGGIKLTIQGLLKRLTGQKIQVIDLRRAGADEPPLYTLRYKDPSNKDQAIETQKTGERKELQPVMADGGLSDSEIDEWFRKAG